jgi:glycosyltransferase involved in cell wall biosynthesis
MKVALVTNMMPPYRVGLFEAINERAKLSLVLDTLSEFNRSWQKDRGDYAFQVIIQNCYSIVYKRYRNDVGYMEKRQFQFSEKTYFLLRKLRPDVIVTIEYGLKSIWSLLYGLIHRVPVILASEGTMHTEGHVGWFKKLIRKTLVSQCARFWSNGPESSALLLSYGAAAQYIDEGMTGIDTKDWKLAVESHMPQRNSLREKWGLKGKVLLFSGSLSSRKGVLQLSNVLETWLLRNPDAVISVLLLGDGEHGETLAQWSESHPNANMVMTGFVQRHDLPAFFAAADWAVLPTLDDNWPLATLETLVAGLPQIFSIYNGATHDLCNPATGIAVDPLDQDSFLRGLDYFYYANNERIPDAVVDQFSAYYSSESQSLRAAESFMKCLTQQAHD